MSFSHVTHHYGRVPETHQTKLLSTTPIVRLTQLADVIYLQGGRCFTVSGDEIPLPDWAPSAMARLTPATLKEAGFDSVPAHDPVTLDTSGPSLWQCPECSKVMDPGAQAAHIAKHNAHRSPEKQLDASGHALH